MTASLERVELRCIRSHAACFQRHGSPPKIMPQTDISLHNTANCESIDLLIRQSNSGLGNWQKNLTIPIPTPGLANFSLLTDPFVNSTFCIRAVKLVCLVPNNQAWKNPDCFSKRGSNFMIGLMFDRHRLFWWEIIFKAEKNQKCASFNNVTRTAAWFEYSLRRKW